MTQGLGLRPRITLLVMGLVALCLAISFGAVYSGSASRLHSRSDADLRAAMTKLQQAVAAGSPQAVVTRATSYLSSAATADSSISSLVQVSGFAPVTSGVADGGGGHGDGGDGPEGADTQSLLSAPLGISRQSLGSEGDVRVLVRQTDASDTLVRFAVAQSTSQEDRANRVVLDAFLLAGVLGMLAALAGGLLIATRIAKPLRSMTRTAALVDEGDLTPRMGDTGRRDEIQALAQSFDQMLERVSDGFDRQGRFVADASHELRTPLTVISGQLEVLAMQQHPSVTDVRTAESLVRLEVDRMSRLVADLLLLARAGEDGLIRPHPIDLPQFLEQIADGMRQTTDHVLKLDPVPAVVVDADADRIAQALRNLLSNAFAHTPRGGTVRLTALVDGDRLRLVVDDQGPGIPEDERARIFDRFTRLDGARTRDNGGAGIGLSIVRTIVEAHHGTVWAGDAPGGGARMTIELPLG